MGEVDCGGEGVRGVRGGWAALAHTHTCAHILYAYTHTQAHTQPHTHTHSLTHSLLHTHLSTHMHTHTHTIAVAKQEPADAGLDEQQQQQEAQVAGWAAWLGAAPEGVALPPQAALPDHVRLLLGALHADPGCDAALQGAWPRCAACLARVRGCFRHDPGSCAVACRPATLLHCLIV